MVCTPSKQNSGEIIEYITEHELNNLEWSKKIPMIQDLDEAVCKLSENNYLNSRIEKYFSDTMITWNIRPRHLLLSSLGTIV